MSHLHNVPPTQAGIEQLNQHLESGNQAIIATYGKCIILTKKSKGYVSLGNDGNFLIGYKRKSILFPGYLKLVEAGYKI
jgi:hypothetical protein